MAEHTTNRVRDRRLARGMSQVGLAAAARLTRQSIGAIEAGRATPAVDVALRLARALGCRVEDLFAPPEGEGDLMAEPAGLLVAGRIALGQVGGRWVAHPLGGELRVSADGLVGAPASGAVPVTPLRTADEARENLLVMGCAAALGIIADRVNARRGPGRVVWLPASSSRALEALSRRQTHVAGVHLVDARTGEANTADVRRLAGESMVLVTLAGWEEGLITAPGNPRGLRGIPDLEDPAVRLVVREAGSGARRLLDQALSDAGLPASVAARSPLVAPGHLEVAHAVAIGAADAGVATRDAAIAYGLPFIPLAEERYDLALPLLALEDPRVQRLLDELTVAPLRQELASLGYDVRHCGDRVAELHVG